MSRGTFAELVVTVINRLLERTPTDTKPPFLIVIYENYYTKELEDHINLGFEAMYKEVCRFLERGIYPIGHIPSREEFEKLVSESDYFQTGKLLTSPGLFDSDEDLYCLYIDLEKAEEAGLNVGGIRKFMKGLQELKKYVEEGGRII